MKSKEWIAVIAVVVIVAVVASLITGSLTGNSIAVNRVVNGSYAVYTVGEVDTKISQLNARITNISNTVVNAPEQYVLRANNFRLAGDGITNITTIQYLRNGVWTDHYSEAREGSSFYIGSMGFGVSKIDRINQQVTIIPLNNNVGVEVFNQNTSIVFNRNNKYMIVTKLY